jgi:hypothetical protein
MNKLMTFELYKSTYMSAADKLEDWHKTRSEELKKHAAESGISAFRGNDEFQSIYGYPFIFQNHSKLNRLRQFLGKFFITGFEDQVYGNYREGYHGVKVIMKSDYGKEINVELCVGSNNDFCAMTLQYQDERGRTYDGKINTFRFENRKDASQFRKFILELVEDGELEDGDEYFTLNTMPINKLYSTN